MNKNEWQPIDHYEYQNDRFVTRVNGLTELIATLIALIFVVSCLLVAINVDGGEPSIDASNTQTCIAINCTQTNGATVRDNDLSYSYEDYSEMNFEWDSSEDYSGSNWRSNRSTQIGIGNQSATDGGQNCGLLCTLRGGR